MLTDDNYFYNYCIKHYVIVLSLFFSTSVLFAGERSTEIVSLGTCAQAAG